MHFFLHVQHVIYSCDGKAEFSVSLLQSLVSHDPSEINLPIWCKQFKRPAFIWSRNHLSQCKSLSLLI